VGQPHLPCAAFKQPGAKGFFQFLDLHRQRRLRDGADVGRAAKMAMQCQGFEVAQLFQGQVLHKANLL